MKNECRYRTTPLSVSVHLDNENPVFGESATHVTVDDEAGGPFLVLTQINEQSRNGEIRVCIDELEMIFQAAKDLMAAQPKET